jgi:hypothetical protein
MAPLSGKPPSTINNRIQNRKSVTKVGKTKHVLLILLYSKASYFLTKKYSCYFKRILWQKEKRENGKLETVHKHERATVFGT